MLATGIGMQRLDQRAKSWPGPLLAEQRLAELRLAARAVQKHHQLTCHAAGQGVTMIGFHQGQREVDPGGDPGAGVTSLVFDVERISDHFDLRVALGEVLAMTPVRSRSVAIEQSSFGEQKGATADRAETAHIRRHPAQAIDVITMAALIKDTAATRSQQRIRCSRLLQPLPVEIGLQHQTAVGDDPVCIACHQRQVIQRPLGQHIGAGKDLPGAGHIEHLTIRVGNQRHAARDLWWGHGTLLPSRMCSAVCGNDDMSSMPYTPPIRTSTRAPATSHLFSLEMRRVVQHTPMIGEKIHQYPDTER